MTQSGAMQSLIEDVRGSTSHMGGIDAIQASPSVILDNIAGVREEVFGDSPIEADAMLDPVTDITEPEATATEDTTIAGDSESGEGEPEMPMGMPGEEETPVRDIYKESTQKLGDVDKKTGAFTYTYDFNLPSARGDIQPIFALNYNSQNQNYVNLAGYGWEYSTPYIKRLNKHGSNVLYENNDYYSSMSGELVAVSIDEDGYGEYRAEVDDGSFLKYIRNADDSWTVTTKEGYTYTFGESATSRQDDPADATHVFKWMLSSTEDTNTNTISYFYFKDGGQIYLDTISYNEYEIDLTYVANANPSYTYESAFKVYSNQILSEVYIKVLAVNAFLFDINTEFGYQTDILHLWYINSYYFNPTEIFFDNTTFEYTEGTDHTEYYYDGDPYIDYPSTSSTVGNYSEGGIFYRHVVSDFNNDSYNDSVVIKKNLSYLDGYYPDLYINNTVDGWDVNTENIPPVPAFNVAEMNGDGFPDLVQNGYDYGADGEYAWYVYLNDQNGGWILSSSWNKPASLPFDMNFSYSSDISNVRLIDINLDGLTDYINIPIVEEGDDAFWDVWLNNGTDWEQLPTWDSEGGLPYYASGNDWPIRFIDINNDGIVDVMRGETTYVSNNEGWVNSETYVPPLVMSAQTQFADLNADGLVDAIDPKFYPERRVYINTGHSWMLHTEDTPLQNDWTEQSYYSCEENECVWFDIDNDNLIDFYSISTAIINNGVNNFEFDTYGYGTPYYFRTDAIADYNADGVFEIIDVLDTHSAISNKIKKNLIKGVASTGGSNVDIIYKPLHIKGRNADGVADFIYGVDTITTDSGYVESTTTYDYDTPLYNYDKPQRVFSGFASISATDTEGNVSKTYFHQGDISNTALGENADHYSKIGKVYRTEQYDDAGNLYEANVTKWDNVDLGGGRYFVKATRNASLTYDSDATHRDTGATYTYDDATGNLTQMIDFGDVTATPDGTFTDIGNDKKTTTISYATNGTGRYAPYVETVKDKTNTKVAEIKHTYDNLPAGQVDRGNETKTSRWVTGTTYANSKASYDLATGNVLTTTDPKNNVTTYAYDAYNLFPTSITNPLGQATSYTYDYSSGKPLTVTDVNANVWTYTYDGLDRVLTESMPDPTTGTSVTAKTYVYSDLSLPRSVTQTTYTDATISNITKTYVDGFGRVIQTRSEMETSPNYAVTDTIYDTRGNIASSTLPYTGSGSSYLAPIASPTITTSFTYDPLSRPLTISNILGTTSYAYDDWTTTVTDARGNTKKLYSDARGNLVQVDEDNTPDTYTTVYTWDTVGNLTKITDALNNIRSFTYDGLGRRLQAQDLHKSADTTFGVWNYTYDMNNNVTSATKPDGTVISYTYDALNRPLTENVTATPTTDLIYVYDTCAEGIGKLCTVTGIGISTSYTYGFAGNTASETKTIDGIPYTTSTTYTRRGEPVIITHPDTAQTKYIFDIAGGVTSIQKKEAGAVVWDNVLTDVDYGPHGGVTYMSFANLVNTTKTYGNMYRLSNLLTQKLVTKLQDLTYGYDSVGNITSIIDASNTNSAKTMTYTYDDLNRLTSATSSGTVAGSAVAETYTYNAIGNILNKSDVGPYQYQGHTGTNYANPHAATKIGGVTQTCDMQGNLLTSAPGPVNYVWTYRDTLAGSMDAGTGYLYDHSNSRVKSTGPGFTTHFAHDTYEKGITSGEVKRYITLGGDTIATIKVSGATVTPTYLHTDHLGGTGVVTDSTGIKIELSDYLPFGGQRLSEGTNDEQHQFTGYEYDDETGLNYAEARYQDPVRGRFISEDPAFWNMEHLKEQLSDPQRWNSYSYAINNPLTMHDPDGESALTFMQGLSTGLAVTAAVGLAIASAPVTIPTAVVAGIGLASTAAVGVGTYKNYQSYVGGEISKDQFDQNAGTLLGGMLMPSVVSEAPISAGSSLSTNSYSSIAKQMNLTSKVFSEKGYSISEHAVERMMQRGVNLGTIERAITAGDKFSYTQKNVTHTGYIDNNTQTFVGVADNTNNITTVIKNVSKNYKTNLVSRNTNTANKNESKD